MSMTASAARFESAIEQGLATVGKVPEFEDVLRHLNGDVERDAQSQSPVRADDEHADEPDLDSSKPRKQQSKRGRKRKQDNDVPLDDADLDLDTKRKLQNRAAQRSFRERKERHLADLERKVVDQAHHIAALTNICERLFAETQALRDGRPALSGPNQPSSTHSGLPSPESAQASPPSGTLDQKPQLSSTISPPALGLSRPAEHQTSPQDAPSTTSQLLYSVPEPKSYPAHSTTATQSSSTLSVAPSIPATVPVSETNSVAHAPIGSEPSDGNFDFDAPFDISDAVPLPPLFQSFLDQYSAAVAGETSNESNQDRNARDSATGPKDDEGMDDVCPMDDDEPPPLPNGKVPCPECDLSVVSCALPMPWRPPSIDAGVESKDVWVSQKAWAKLCSHPLFAQCEVDELCTELRDRTRCSDDGRLVITKADVCDVFRSIPQRARIRAQQMEMTKSGVA